MIESSSVEVHITRLQRRSRSPRVGVQIAQGGGPNCPGWGCKLPRVGVHPARKPASSKAERICKKRKDKAESAFLEVGHSLGMSESGAHTAHCLGTGSTLYVEGRIQTRSWDDPSTGQTVARKLALSEPKPLRRGIAQGVAALSRGQARTLTSLLNDGETEAVALARLVG
jgi:hypothetical protein